MSPQENTGALRFTIESAAEFGFVAKDGDRVVAAFTNERDMAMWVEARAKNYALAMQEHRLPRVLQQRGEPPPLPESYAVVDQQEARKGWGLWAK